MNLKKTTLVVAAILALSRLIFGSTPSPISPAALETIITQHTPGTADFILIDVRDDSEVKDGIIATEYCKPYHMSWNSGKFDSCYQLLPKSKRIIIYCRSGNRSKEAAKKLLGAGYDSIGSMTDGINSYNQTKLADSTEFKPLSKLPESSYFGASAIISRNNQRYNLVVPSTENHQQFTLQGRIIRQSAGKQQNAPIYILERIGENTSHKINGLHRLIQER